MDTFFKYLKKGLVSTVFVVFAFVFTYVPQPHNEVKTVEAGGGIATESTQILNNVQLAAVNVSTTASAAFDAITSFATNSLWTKEFFLDGIAWAIAKRFVQQMVASLIDWINSGFQGSPMFLQDMQGFLLQAADEVIGEYISELGDIGSFICSPFRLDVQLAVSLTYAQARSNQPAPTCTLSGIIDNIDGFLSGAFSEGGWNDWIDMTSQPSVYTPYGSILSAVGEARVRIMNAQGEELTLLDFGDGFLSGELCELIDGEEECFITKPGKIVEEALSFNLDSGRQSLITADEFNEIIAALLGQLANQVFQGAAGLLGLSGGTGYTYSGAPYTDDLRAQSAVGVDLSNALTVIEDDLDIQTNIQTEVTSRQADLTACAAGTGVYIDLTEAERSACQNMLDEANRIIAETATSVPQLSTIISTWGGATEEEQLQLLEQWGALNLYSQPQLTAFINNAETALNRNTES